MRSVPPGQVCWSGQPSTHASVERAADDGHVDGQGAETSSPEHVLTLTVPTVVGVRSRIGAVSAHRHEFVAVDEAIRIASHDEPATIIRAFVSRLPHHRSFARAPSRGTSRRER